MQTYNILIVEDEFINAKFLAKAVTQLGYSVVKRVTSAQKAIEIVDTQQVDIIFMDIDLEGDMDGINCAKVISKNHQIPIIYTTAFQDSKTIKEATQTNLYGYLIKPFDFADVEVALHIAIKQSSLDSSYQLLCGVYEFYSDTETIFKDGQPINLTNNELKLFITLLQNINHNVSNEYLAYSVWEEEEIDIARIRNNILRLRKKLPDLSIETITGIGYMLRDCP